MLQKWTRRAIGWPGLPALRAIVAAALLPAAAVLLRLLHTPPGAVQAGGILGDGTVSARPIGLTLTHTIGGAAAEGQEQAGNKGSCLLFNTATQSVLRRSQQQTWLGITIERASPQTHVPWPWQLCRHRPILCTVRLNEMGMTGMGLYMASVQLPWRTWLGQRERL